MPFDVDFTVSLAGGLLRAAESLCEASPFLVCGLIVAATFRRLVGHAGVRTLFGDGTRTGLLRAWAVGMLLPVDALGVLPVAREMRRAGLRGGTILAFALSAPLFNPLSLLYGLTLSDPAAVLAFGFGSLLVVTGAGFAWDRLFPETAEAEDPPPAPVAVGIKRLIAVAVAGGREAAGGTVPLVLAALVGPFLLGAVLPKGVLGTAVNGGNPLAPLLTTAVAIPAYASPMAAMGTVGSMFQHGNSVGAAFAMLALGAGTTFGLIIWAWRSYGPLRAAVMFAAIVAVTLGLSYGIDRPLRADGADEGGHTHAFDRYTAPFSAKAAPDALWTATWNELDPQVHETFALIALAATIAFGVAVRLLGGRLGLDDWLVEDGATKDEVRAGCY
ncbi:MAG: permease, partial [Planctomycetota bacterium]